ncbi:MAG: ribosome assembly factor SBDS [Candidatus Woesearchaeota archaeon]|nr:ribosome assembly factor SBDS [Candidatus Woesearchaeota archaeon]
MVDVNKAVIARLKEDGKIFEILVDENKALEYRTGKSVSLSDIIAVDDIFKDVKKGDKASEHDLLSVFKTNDVFKISDEIIKKGDIQLTAQHTAKVREEKRKRIIDLIRRNAIDAKTGLPHPPQRIESAMEEAKVHIDDHKTAEEQVEDVLKKIRVIIPIKFETKEIEVIIPAKFAGQSYHILKKYKMLKDEWLSNGNLQAIIEIPSGVQDDLFNDLNKICHGEVESKILKVK